MLDKLNQLTDSHGELGRELAVNARRKKIIKRRESIVFAVDHHQFKMRQDVFVDDAGRVHGMDAGLHRHPGEASVGFCYGVGADKPAVFSRRDAPEDTAGLHVVR